MSESTSDPPAAAKARRPGTVVAAAILLALGATQAVWFAFSGSAESGSGAVLEMLPWRGLLLYVVPAWGVWTGRRGPAPSCSSSTDSVLPLRWLISCKPTYQPKPLA